MYIALFWVLKALYIEGGDLLNHHQCAASTMDDATAAILRQNAQHTPTYWWREDRVMKPIRVWGILGGHDGHDGGQWGKFGQEARVTPLLYFKRHPGIFYDHRESGPRFSVSSEGRCFLHYSVPVTILGFRTHTDYRVRAGLTNTSSSSNLVFPGGLPSRYWPG